MSVHTIAVIGAGASGRFLAQRALRAGYRIVLEDFSIRTLEEAAASIRQALEGHSHDPVEMHLQGDRSSVETPVHGSVANLLTCDNIEDAIRDADLIIETAADEMETKLELFTIFDKFARPDAIFATTSALHSVADIAEVTSCPERCVGLHFDLRENPTRLTVIAGPQTSQSTMNRCTELAERLGFGASTLTRIVRGHVQG